LPIANARHLERALTGFVDHYNSHWAHRSLNLEPPISRPANDQPAGNESLSSVVVVLADWFINIGAGVSRIEFLHP